MMRLLVQYKLNWQNFKHLKLTEVGEVDGWLVGLDVTTAAVGVFDGWLLGSEVG